MGEGGCTQELENGENDRAGWSIRTESGSTQGKLDYWLLCKDAAVGDIVIRCVEIGVVWSLVWTNSASPAGLELPEL